MIAAKAVIKIECGVYMSYFLHNACSMFPYQSLHACVHIIKLCFFFKLHLLFSSITYESFVQGKYKSVKNKTSMAHCCISVEWKPDNSVPKIIPNQIPWTSRHHIKME